MLSTSFASPTTAIIKPPSIGCGRMDTSRFSASGRRPRRVLKEYDYTDENGARLYQTVRFEPKDFRQRRSDGNGGWIWKGPERPVPYKLPELIESGNAPVLIAGGEKDVDNLRALGFTATCNHGGEGKWWPELTPYLKDRRVFILCDNDEQGEKHQAVVGAALNGVASEIRVVRFPELPAKGDVSDFIEQRRKDGLMTWRSKRNWRSGSVQARRGRRRRANFVT